MKRHEFQMPLLVIGLLFGPLARAEPSAPAPSRVSPEVATDPTRMLAPPTGEGPVIVQASLALHDVTDIDDTAETFQFSGILKLTWRDPRQAFDPREAGVPEKLYQGEYQFDEISPAWYPQVVLANEAGLYEKHGVLLRVQPDGTQTLYESVNGIAKTHFALRRMPFDVQTLRAVFEVLAMDASEVRFDIEEGTGGSVASEIRIPQWTVARTTTGTDHRNASELGGTSGASRSSC